MSIFNINKAVASDYSSLDDYEIDSKIMDSATGQDETEVTFPKFTQYWGYFNAVPELKNAILLKAVWVVGKGWKAGAIDEALLQRIRGWGKDTFDDIIFNMVIVSRINGDSFAEIIRDDNGVMVNLKPLCPTDMKIIVDRKGLIKRYEKTNKVTSQTIRFKPEDIFHLSHNRLGDQIHGISDIETIEPIILAEQSSFSDMNKIIRFQAKPFIVFKLKTDDETKIQLFANKIRSARNLGEDMFIPDDENLLSYEVVQVNPSNILMAWRDDLRNKFYRTIGLPQIVPGGSGQSTESESKVIYVAFEQIVMHEQRYLEKQILQQLGIKIDFVHPTLMEEMLVRDEKKDAGNVFSVQPNEMPKGAVNNG